jgi:hypothetical protein
VTAVSEELAFPKRPVKRVAVMLILLLVVIYVFCIASSEHRLMGAKIIVTLMFSALGIAALIVQSNASQWREELSIAEKQMDVLRDEVLVAGMVARAQMADARERMKKDPEKEHSEIVAALMKQAVPLISMVVKKERSAITWGLAGLKLVRHLVRFFASKA